MQWNWQQSDWPDFTYNTAVLKQDESLMDYASGFLVGECKHLSDENKDYLKIEILADEALTCILHKQRPEVILQ